MAAADALSALLRLISPMRSRAAPAARRVLLLGSSAVPVVRHGSAEGGHLIRLRAIARESARNLPRSAREAGVERALVLRAGNGGSRRVIGAVAADIAHAI